MNKILPYLILFASLKMMGQTISFGGLGSGFDSNSPRSLYFDSINNKLYAGGHFKYADNKLVWGIAQWNGQTWDSLAGGLSQFPQNASGPPYSLNYIYKIVRYKNKIFCAGTFDYVNGIPASGLIIWNGNSWEYPTELPDGQIRDLIVHDSLLYACGMFTKFGSTTCRYFAKYNGVNWQPIGDFDSYCTNAPAQINSIEFYKNEIYAGGAWDDSNLVPQNIAKFDGSNWKNVGTGIKQGGVNFINDLEVFRNELYIGGRFYQSSEIPANSLIKWDGNTFKPTGYTKLTSGSFPVFQLKASKNKLAVIGNFYKPNDTTTYNLFFIDSVKACYINDLDTMYKNGGFSVCEFIRDSLVVGGVFSKLGNVPANCIGVLYNFDSNTDCSYTGISKNQRVNESFKIYPNPANDLLTIENASELAFDVEIVSMMGQIVYQFKTSDKIVHFATSELSAGIYTIKLTTGASANIMKLMIAH